MLKEIKNKTNFINFIILPAFLFLFGEGSRVIRNAPEIPADLLALYEKSAQSGRQKEVEYSKQWKNHIDNSKKMIKKGAEEVANKDKVTVLGGLDNVGYLVRNFKEVKALSLDYENLSEKKKKLGENLKSKVEIKQEDITGIIAPLVEKSKSIIKESKTATEAVGKIEKLMNEMKMPQWKIPNEEKSDYVVCSLVLSQLMEKEFEYIEDMFIDRFTLQNASSVLFGSSWEKTKRKFKGKVVNSVVNRIKETLRPNGRVYIADTVLKNSTEIDKENSVRVVNQEEKFSKDSFNNLIRGKFKVYSNNNWKWSMLPPEDYRRGIEFKVEAFIIGHD